MYLNGKTILITGGTGSLGKQLTSILLEIPSVEKIIILSRDELKQSQMRQRLNNNKLRFFIGDVRDKERLKLAFRDVDIVIHAAALKQVPVCEYNPFEAIQTNILGAKNVIDVSMEYNVEKVIALSTDKAANPINLYGATKLCSDKLFTASNFYVGDRDTKLSVVRYGNVLGSRGSVIPFFQKEKDKGILPITHFDMTRFWITIEDAAKFILNMLEIMIGGEIFVPKIPSMKIVDLANVIGPDCKLKEVGIRPGEKLHEIMIPSDEARATLELDRFYVIQPAISFWDKKEKGYLEEAKSVSDRFEYASNKNKWILSVEELNKLIKDSYE